MVPLTVVTKFKWILKKQNCLELNKNIQNHTYFGIQFGIQPCLQLHYLKNNVKISMSYKK